MVDPMNPPQPAPAVSGSATASAPVQDGFALAAARLSAHRPVRHPRLLQVVSELQHNRVDVAERMLARHLARNPADVDAISLMARVAVRLGDTDKAVQLLERCLKIAPDFLAARFNYASLLAQRHQFEAALKELDRLLARDSRNPLYRQLQADVLESTGEAPRALSLCEALAADNPGRCESWIRYGHALRAMGAQDRSIAAYRKAIECRPSSGSAYWSLANLKTLRFGDEDIAAMQAQLKRTDLSEDDRITLQFALGKAFEDQCAFEQSFVQYDRANATMRLRIDYDAETLSEGVRRNKLLLTPELFRSRQGAGCQAPDPIFILGRPRSGSTLVEQILSSHTAIEGTAELPYIPMLAARLHRGRGPAYDSEYLKVLAGMDASALAALGEEYIHLTRLHRRQGRAHFIDKKPANFSHVGLIHLILPNAKIIDVRRHPAACCLSMFKSYSSKGRLRLSELGRFYRDYVALMAHFDRVLPGRVHRLIYEQLVADPEAEIRRLLDYLGLPFQADCLRFHDLERTVLTPSSEQVRQPLSAGAVGHWRHFQPWLSALIDSLGSVYADYPGVPAELR